MNFPIDITHYFNPVQPHIMGLSDDLAYEQLRPDVRLQKYIYCYWQLKTNRALKEPMDYTIVADGCIDVFFELDNPRDNYVMGFSETCTSFNLNKSFNYIGIRFLPSMFSQIFKINARELSNQFHNLAHVSPTTSRFISENMEGKDNFLTIKQSFDNYFLSIIDDLAFDLDSRLYKSLHLILQKRGVVNTQEDLNFGVSPRQLRRLFEFYIGDTPKAFSQVVRFQNILKAQPSDKFLKQEKFYFDFGYYDQSHFIKEFKKMSGITPTKAFGK